MLKILLFEENVSMKKSFVQRKNPRVSAVSCGEGLGKISEGAGGGVKNWQKMRQLICG